MNLAIDIGNTNVKCGIFEGQILRKSCCIEELSEQALAEFLKGHGKAQNTMVANVRSNECFCQYLDFMEKYTEHVELLSAQTPIPLKNHYKTPQTLGADRLAMAAGANAIYPNANILIISAGTALTYELITKGEYIGGNISLGLNMRYKALHDYTKKLPLLQPRVSMTTDVGQTTQDAITAGVQHGMLYEIHAAISFFEGKYSCLKIILTGGDASFIAVMLPQVEIVENLTLIGLNAILEFLYHI